MSEESVRIEFKLSKDDIQEEQRIAFGWASVVVTKDGQEYVDHHNHIIPEVELEAAVYDFVRMGGVASEMHVRWYVGQIVESMVFTTEKMKRLGIPEGTLPCGWWVGIKVFDDEVWEKVKDGKYPQLSISGTAIMEDAD